MNTVEESVSKITLIRHDTSPYWGKEIMLMDHRGCAYVRMYWYNDDSRNIYIECLSVSKQYRNKGIATWLLKEVERIANDLQAETLTLSVKQDSWMCEWYKRIGYHWFHWDSQAQNTVWLRKQI